MRLKQTKAKLKVPNIVEPVKGPATQQGLNSFEKQGNEMRSNKMLAIQEQSHMTGGEFGRGFIAGKTGLVLLTVPLPKTQDELDNYNGKLNKKAKSAGEIDENRGVYNLGIALDRISPKDKSANWKAQKTLAALMRNQPEAVTRAARDTGSINDAKDRIEGYISGSRTDTFESLVKMSEKLEDYSDAVGIAADTALDSNPDKKVLQDYKQGLDALVNQQKQVINDQARDILGKEPGDEISRDDIQKAIGVSQEKVKLVEPSTVSMADVNADNITEEIDLTSQDVSQGVSADNLNTENLSDQEKAEKFLAEHEDDMFDESILEQEQDNLMDDADTQILPDADLPVINANSDEDNLMDDADTQILPDADLPVLRANSDEDNPSELIDLLRNHFSDKEGRTVNDLEGDEAGFSVKAGDDVNLKIQMSEDGKSINMVPQNDDGVNDIVSAMKGLQDNDSSLNVELSGNADMMQLKCLNGCIDQGVKVSGDLDAEKYQKLFQDENGDPKDVEYKDKNGNDKSMSYDTFKGKLDGYKAEQEQEQQQEEDQRMDSP